MGRPTRSSRDRESSTNDDLGGLRRRGTAKHALYFGHCKCLDMSAHHPCPPLRTPTVPWHAEWIYDREGPLYSKSKGPDCNRTYMVSGYVKKDHWWQSQRGTVAKKPSLGGGEVVCWVPLLDRMRQFQEQLNAIYFFSSILEIHDASGEPIYHMYEAPTVPCIQILKRLWDFMVCIGSAMEA